LLPTVQSLRKQPRIGLHDQDRALDLRAKLRGRLQLAVGDEHSSAGEVIGK
jgi:hypothetical protein